MGALNPGIILSIGQNAQQQQPPNLLGQYQQIQQIQANKMAMQAQQQNYQTAGIKQQEAQMALQQQQQAAQQQQQLVALLQKHGGDVDKAAQEAIANGNTQGFALQKNAQEAKDLVAKTQKDTEEAAKTHLETQQKGLDRIGSMASRVLNTSPELQGIAYQGVRAQAQALQIPGADQLPPVWDETAKAALQNIQQGSITAADQIKQKLEAGRDVETGRHNQALETQAATNETNLQGFRGAEVENMNASRQLEAKRVGIEGVNAQTARASLGLRQAEFAQNYGAGGEGAGSTPLPGAMETIAQQVANGEKKLPRGMKGYNAISMRAQALNPKLGDQTYDTVQSYLNADGKAHQKMTGIARILGHIEEYKDASEKLGTSAATALGMTTPQNAGLMKKRQAIADEFTGLVAQGHMTESQAHQAEAGLDSGRQGTRDASVKGIEELLKPQFQALYQGYTTATGQPLPAARIFDKQTQRRLTTQFPDLAQNVSNPGAAAGSGAAPGVTAAPGVPSVGAMFNGEKVLKVTRVK
jgi:hypothetical protein